MKKNYVVIAAMMLAMSMSACGANSTPEATTAAATTAAATETATEAATEAASEAATEAAEETTAAVEAESGEATSAVYTVKNTTGSKVTDLYLYEAGSKEKGENLAGEGLADGETVTITRDEDADKQKEIKYTLEFTTEDGTTQHFDTLSYETVGIDLKSADAASGATPIAFKE